MPWKNSQPFLPVIRALELGECLGTRDMQVVESKELKAFLITFPTLRKIYICSGIAIENQLFGRKK